jgi:hypothetical protein
VAEYFDLDPVIVRIAAVVLLFSGPGFFAYVLAWIFVPAEPGGPRETKARISFGRHDRGAQVFGIILVALAVSLIWGDWWGPGRHIVFPLALMALGAWLLLRHDEERPAGGADLRTAPPPAPPEPSPVGDLGAEPRDPMAAWGPDPGDTTVVDVLSSEPTETGGADHGGSRDEPPTAADVPAAPEPPAQPLASMTQLRRRRILGPIVFGSLLIWAGLAWLADVSVQTGLAGGLLILGVGFVLGAFVGGSKVLILPAFLMGVALAVTSVLDIPLAGPVGTQHWTPGAVAEVSSTYELSVGEGTLDLTAVPLRPSDHLVIDASVGVGHLLVIVPDDAAVGISTDVGAGDALVLEDDQNGVGVHTDHHLHGDQGRIDLHLQMGIGQVEVQRARSTAARRS